MNKSTKLGAWAAGIFLVMQLVPYGRDHHNPVVMREPAWDRAATRALAVRACYDCHSNQTVWPWYAWVAPVSWLVTNDVMGGRAHLNFSEWDRPQEGADEAIDAVLEGYMPLRVYTPLHAEARLTDPLRRQLVDGFRATPGLAEPTSNGGHDDD